MANDKDTSTLAAAKTLASFVSNSSASSSSSEEEETPAGHCPKCSKKILGNTTKFSCNHVFCKSCSANKTSCMSPGCDGTRVYNRDRHIAPQPNPPVRLTFSATPQAPAPTPVASASAPASAPTEEPPRKRVKYPMQVETTLTFGAPVKCPLCIVDAPNTFATPRLLRDHLMTTHATAEERATMFFHVQF